MGPLLFWGPGSERYVIRWSSSGEIMLLLLVLTCLPGLLFAQFLPTATYYVTTTGSNLNNGTSSTTPFLTITYALIKCNGGADHRGGVRHLHGSRHQHGV